MTLTTDYLVVGAGMSGLAFADELINHTDAHITLVDRRDAAGGHWNDAYPFVKLHQPSVFYGVGSRDLTEYRIDEAGPNKGLLSLAEGPEITAYAHGVMRDRLLASGRVRFLPLTEYQPDGKLRNLLSGATESVTIRRKLVDASYFTNIIPLTHARNFTVEAELACIPPNHAPRLAPGFSHFTVLGGGKTAIDTVLWLLSRGAAPGDITWVTPRDSWFMNRAKTQPGPEFFTEVFTNFADQRDDMANAANARELAHLHEKSGTWLRLDPAVEPEMYHAATMSVGEVEALRPVRNVIRLGRVHHISRQAITLEKGEIPARPGTLYIDCTASALTMKPPVTVFDGNRITLQLLRFPLIPFSAGLTAVLETHFQTDAERNSFARPVPMTNTVEDYIRMLKVDMENRIMLGRDKTLRNWAIQSRLDGYGRIAAGIDKADAEKQAVLARVREASQAAYFNLPRLLASIGEAA